MASWISFAQATQGGINPDSNHKISTGKEVLEDGEGAATAAIGGRKMVVVEKRHMKDVKMSSGGAVVGTSSTKTKSKCDNIHLGCEQTVVSGHFSDEVDESSSSAGFVAFNADYHAPRHHPPKNN
ncbi:hypothetical protein PTKIN_Ptkin02bG0029600 [Pterospermum kingtungense]